jgi:hypothetical protein
MDMRAIPLFHDTRETVTLFWNGDTLLGYRYSECHKLFDSVKVVLESAQPLHPRHISHIYSFGTCVSNIQCS